MIFSYIIILTCLWWVLFFMILPFGNQIQQKPELGHADSAPTNPRMGLKMAITSIISFPLAYLVLYLINHGYFVKFAEELMKIYN